jgi:hypothetical protein
MVVEDDLDEWWDEEDDWWSEEIYYQTLAAHFEEKYRQHVAQYLLDCE